MSIFFFLVPQQNGVFLGIGSRDSLLFLKYWLNVLSWRFVSSRWLCTFSLTGFFRMFSWLTNINRFLLLRNLYRFLILTILIYVQHFFQLLNSRRKRSRNITSAWCEWFPGDWPLWFFSTSFWIRCLLVKVNYRVNNLNFIQFLLLFFLLIIWLVRSELNLVIVFLGLIIGMFPWLLIRIKFKNRGFTRINLRYKLGPSTQNALLMNLVVIFKSSLILFG